MNKHFIKEKKETLIPMRKGISNFLVDMYYDCNCTRHVWTWLYNADHLVPSPFASCSFQVLPQFPTPFPHRKVSHLPAAILSNRNRGENVDFKTVFWIKTFYCKEILKIWNPTMKKKMRKMMSPFNIMILWRQVPRR